ncbi:MAG: hypothetical protein NT031_08015 [Planctomycetota bacterium]|nr:hypothetical protein [Planctomycetota bacterium]
MQFIRDNLFYVVLVSAALLIAGVVVAIGASAGGDADEQLAKRDKADATLNGFHRDLPTKGAVKAEQDRVAKVNVQAKRVEETTLKWNRGEYPMFETQDFKVADKPFPAFRVDPPRDDKTTQEMLAKWKKDSTDWQKDSYSEHTGAYISLMTKLVLEELRSTTPPTPSAIAREREARLFRLKNERGDKERGEVRTRLAGAARTARETTPVKSGDDVKAVHMIVSRAESPEARADADARNQLAVAQSEQGYVYADLRAFNPVFVERQSIMLPGDRAKLWGAWVHYRVSRDIAFAIRDTIVDVLKDATKATVPQSPIKRLQEVMVNPLPYTGGTVSFADARGGSGAGGPAAQARTSGASSLTGRVSNSQYDVIRYQFTVVMADKYVGQLIERLYRQNDHFVLSFRMEPVDTGGAVRGAGAGAGAGEAADESLCNYGVDPVMRVTFDCELLMRTGWCRDLMPEDVLATLKSASGVLRPQDLKRLSQASSGRGY